MIAAAKELERQVDIVEELIRHYKGQDAWKSAWCVLDTCGFHASGIVFKANDIAENVKRNEPTTRPRPDRRGY